MSWPFRKDGPLACEYGEAAVNSKSSGGWQEIADRHDRKEQLLLKSSKCWHKRAGYTGVGLCLCCVLSIRGFLVRTVWQCLTGQKGKSGIDDRLWIALRSHPTCSLHMESDLSACQVRQYPKINVENASRQMVSVKRGQADER